MNDLRRRKKSPSTMQRGISLNLKFPKIDGNGRNDEAITNDFRSPILPKPEYPSSSLAFPAISEETAQKFSASSISRHRADTGFQGDQPQRKNFTDQSQKMLLPEEATETKNRFLPDHTSFNNATVGCIKKQNATEHSNKAKQKLSQPQQKRVQYSRFYEIIEETRVKKYRHRLKDKEAFDISSPPESSSEKKCQDWLSDWFRNDGFPREVSPSFGSKSERF